VCSSVVAVSLRNRKSVVGVLTPESAGSALMIGKIALMMLVAVGMSCQNKLSQWCLPLIE